MQRHRFPRNITAGPTGAASDVGSGNGVLCKISITSSRIRSRTVGRRPQATHFGVGTQEKLEEVVSEVSTGCAVEKEVQDLSGYDQAVGQTGDAVEMRWHVLE